MTDYEDTVGKIFEAAAPTDDAATKFTKTFDTVGLAVATGGASLAAQKLYDDNKVLAEKARQLCLFGVWHFAKNVMGEFVGE